jgi:hypothetical protein
VYTAQDIATIDAYGLCLENLVCGGANFFTNLTVCENDISTLSEACQEAGETPPDGGIENPDGGGGETTTTGGTGG